MRKREKRRRRRTNCHGLVAKKEKRYKKETEIGRNQGINRFHGPLSLTEILERNQRINRSHGPFSLTEQHSQRACTLQSAQVACGQNLAVSSLRRIALLRSHLLFFFPPFTSRAATRATAAALRPAARPGLRRALCRRRAATTPGMPAPFSSLPAVQS
jgi:hypothetical protein